MSEKLKKNEFEEEFERLSKSAKQYWLGVAEQVIFLSIWSRSKLIEGSSIEQTELQNRIAFIGLWEDKFEARMKEEGYDPDNKQKFFSICKSSLDKGNSGENPVSEYYRVMTLLLEGASSFDIYDVITLDKGFWKEKIEKYYFKNDQSRGNSIPYYAIYKSLSQSDEVFKKLLKFSPVAIDNALDELGKDICERDAPKGINGLLKECGLLQTKDQAIERAEKLIHPCEWAKDLHELFQPHLWKDSYLAYSFKAEYLLQDGGEKVEVLGPKGKNLREKLLISREFTRAILKEETFFDLSQILTISEWYKNNKLLGLKRLDQVQGLLSAIIYYDFRLKLEGKKGFVLRNISLMRSFSTNSKRAQALTTVFIYLYLCDGLEVISEDQKSNFELNTVLNDIIENGEDYGRFNNITRLGCSMDVWGIYDEARTKDRFKRPIRDFDYFLNSVGKTYIEYHAKQKIHNFPMNTDYPIPLLF